MQKKLGRKPRELTAEERSTVYISLIRGATIREASLTIGISEGTLRKQLKQPWRAELDKGVCAFVRAFNCGELQGRNV